MTDAIVIRSFVPITGAVYLELLDENGELKAERYVDNLVVDAGESHIADQLSSTPGSAAMGWMAIGTGATAVAFGDTALGAEVDRNALTSRVDAGNVVTYVGTWAAGDGTNAALREAGIFNQSTLGGTMLARTVYPNIAKAAGDTLTIYWTITFGTTGAEMADYLVREEDGTSHLEQEENTDDLILEEGGWTDHVLNVDDTVALSDEARLKGFGGRVTRQAIEVVETPDDAKARLTRQVAEVVISPPPPPARVTRQAVEVVIAPPDPPGRVTQQAVEVLVTGDAPPGRVTRQVVEVVYSYTEPPFKPRVWAWF